MLNHLLFHRDAVGGSSVFHVAARMNNAACIRKLMKHLRKSIHKVNDNSNANPLVLACSKLNFDAANAILDLECDIARDNKKSNNNENENKKDDDEGDDEEETIKFDWLNDTSFVGKMTPLLVLCSAAERAQTEDSAPFDRSQFDLLYHRMVRLGADPTMKNLMSDHSCGDYLNRLR